MDESTASNSPEATQHNSEEGNGGSERPQSRSASAQSGEINPLVYALPPIDVPFIQPGIEQVMLKRVS